MTLRDKLKFWILLCNYVEKVVSGTSPLTLDDAIAGGLQYVKAFGGTEQRNLPDNYIQRQFIYMMDGSYLLTDIVPTSDMRIEMDFQTTTVPAGRTAFYLGARTGNAGDGISFGHDSGNNFQVDGFTGTRFLDTATHFSNNTRYLFSWNNGVVKLLKDNVVASTNTFNPTLTTTFPLAIDGYNIEGSINSNIEGIYLYSFKVWNAQGELVADYVPAVQKGAVPVVGFYDTVSKTFKTATAGTFAAGGEAVPTPDTPMDIVSNNGVLKARHASGLPLGYTLLDYIESTGTQAISTGINYDGNDFVVKWKAVDNSTSNSTLFATKASSPFGGGFYGTNLSRKYYVGTQPAGGMTINYSSNDGLVHTWEATVSGQSATLKKDGTQVGTDTFTGDVDTTRSIYLFCGGWASSGDPTLGQFASWRLYSWQLWKSGVLSGNFIPAKRNSDNVIGMYDTVSGQFFTNAGTGVFVAGDPVSDPVEIYADGAVETINVHGKNLFDGNIEQGAFASSTGVKVDNANWVRCQDFIPVSSNTMYSLSCKPVAGKTTVAYVFAYDRNKNFIRRLVDDGVVPFNFTTGANIEFINIQFGFNPREAVNINTFSEIQLEQGSTATTYEPYYDGGTATAEMLLSLGDYTDEQEIISGVVTRKVGVAVLDGTETWTYDSSSTRFWFETSDFNSVGTRLTPMYSSHFYCVDDGRAVANIPNNSIYSGGTTTDIHKIFFQTTNYTTVDAWKQFLATQYAAGTPVIIVYPLATETTDTVTGQPMNTTAGDNILEITQASLDGLELEAKYKQSK